MSPRHEPKIHPRDPQTHTGAQTGQDKERNNEDDRVHPMAHPYPHPTHYPQDKRVLVPRHDAHSHPHGDELPAHTNPPGPLKPSKKMTQTGKSWSGKPKGNTDRSVIEVKVKEFSLQVWIQKKLQRNPAPAVTRRN